MVSVFPYQGIDGYNALTRVDIESTVYADSSSCGKVSVRYYTDNSSDCYSPKESAAYKEAKERIRKYLQSKKILQLKSGWKNPPVEVAIFDGSRKQPVFKDYAKNSNRGQ